MEDHELLDTYSYLMRIRENFQEIKNKKYNLENFSDFDSAIKNKYAEKSKKKEKKPKKEEEKPKEEEEKPKEEEEHHHHKEKHEHDEENEHKKVHLREKIRFKSNMYWLYIIFFVLIGLILLSLILRHFLYRPVQQPQIPMNYDNTSYIAPPQPDDVIKPKGFSIIESFKSFFQKKNEVPPAQPTPVVGGGIKRRYKRKL